VIRPSRGWKANSTLRSICTHEIVICAFRREHGRDPATQPEYRADQRKLYDAAVAAMRPRITTPEWPTTDDKAWSARRISSGFHDVQPGGTGPTRLKAIVPDKPLLLPAVKL
jgi:hypothetical protein